MKTTTIKTLEGNLVIKPAKKGVTLHFGSRFFGLPLNTERRLSRVIEALIEARTRLS